MRPRNINKLEFDCESCNNLVIEFEKLLVFLCMEHPKVFDIYKSRLRRVKK